MLINVDCIYPVGSIYITVSSVSPATLFGGTWEKIEGRFLCGTGTATQNNYNGFGTIQNEYLDPNQFGLSLGLTSGEYNHKLTASEMPAHSHRSTGHTYGSYASGGNLMLTAYDSNWPAYGYAISAGGDQYHNNMPPFLAVNM